MLDGVDVICAWWLGWFEFGWVGLRVGVGVVGFCGGVGVLGCVVVFSFVIFVWVFGLF